YYRANDSALNSIGSKRETGVFFRSHGDQSHSPDCVEKCGSTHDCRGDFAQISGAMLYCNRVSIGRRALVLRQIAIFLGLLVVGSSPLGAQVTLDVSKLTCEQFAMYKVTNPKYL